MVVYFTTKTFSGREIHAASACAYVRACGGGLYFSCVQCFCTCTVLVQTGLLELLEFPSGPQLKGGKKENFGRSTLNRAGTVRVAVPLSAHTEGRTGPLSPQLEWLGNPTPGPPLAYLGCSTGPPTSKLAACLP